MLPWDHNAWYHPTLLARLPPRCGRVLEVGCGAGELAARLGARADRVDALDRSPEMIAAARQVVPANVRLRLADVMTETLPDGAYDAVVSVSTLHHLPLQPALLRFARALRPGGVLVAVALPRRDLPREIPVEVAASAVHHALGVALLAARLAGRPAYRPTHRRMPVREPVLTTAQVRRQAAEVLPGVTVRRLLLWRYLLVWHRPEQS